MLNDQEKAVFFYKKVIVLDSTNVESIACLAANNFYSDQVYNTYLINFIFNVLFSVLFLFI